MSRLATTTARDPDRSAETEQRLRSAAQLGDAQATHKLGVTLWRRGEYDAGEALIHHAASQGCQDAIATMGQLCEQRGDTEAAHTWFALVTDGSRW